jgi:hypothetical protein
MFKPGESGNPAGKPKGATNHLTRAVKEALEEAFEELGGVPSLVQFGRRNPGAFYQLWVKTLPKDIKVSGGGDPITIIVQTGVPPAEKPNDAARS